MEDPDRLYQWYEDIPGTPLDHQMRPYLLIDVDCSGFLEIERRDEHPGADEAGGEQTGLTDEEALLLAEQDADAGDEEALRMVMAHAFDVRTLALHFGYERQRPLRYY